MKIRIITTITTLVDLETFTPEHTMEIDAGDSSGLPLNAVYAAVEGGCKAALNSVRRARDES